VFNVLIPWGNQHYSSGTAQAVLDYAPLGAHLIFSCGWHITRDGKDVYPPSQIREEKIIRWLTRIVPFIDIDDQVEACRRIFASDMLWKVVRGSELEEGESQGMPVWSRHVGDPVLESNKTRRIDCKTDWLNKQISSFNYKLWLDRQYQYYLTIPILQTKILSKLQDLAVFTPRNRDGSGSSFVRSGSHEKPITDVDRFLSSIQFDSREKVQDLMEKGGK